MTFKTYVYGFLLFIGLCFFVSAAQATDNADSISKEGAGPHIEIWLPPDFRDGKGPWPLVIFSHGFGGCARQVSFLTSYLADEGYIVAAPDHADGNPCFRSGREGDVKLGNGLPEKPFRFAEQWSDQTYIKRRDDIRFTLESLRNDPRFKDVIDEKHIGLMGHSLGGYTVMGLGGAWPSWKDARFKAIVAFSPYTAPYALKGDVESMNIPVMYQGGTLDKGMTPLLKSKIFPAAATPKYYVEFDGAGHAAWTEHEKRWQGHIKRTTLAFFDRYLRGNPAPVLPVKPDKGVKIYTTEE